MRKLRRLSGREVVRFLERHGFEPAGGKGSHAKMRRQTPNGVEMIIVPMHRQLDIGMCADLAQKAFEFLPFDDVDRFFYSR